VMTRVITTCAVALTCALAMPAPTPAQSEPFVQMATTVVKNDMVPEYEELIKEGRDALEEIELPFYLVYRVAQGAANQYISFQPVSSFAEFDSPRGMLPAMGQAGFQAWISRLNKTHLGRRVDILRARHDLSIPLAEGRRPTLALLRTVVALPGRNGDYAQWITDNWVPAMRDAGMNGVFHFQAAPGVGQGMWHRMELRDTWADFDGGHPVARHVGQQAFGEILANNAQMTHAPDIKILSLRPELSILP
jgi:hypothetical protein